MAVGAGIIGGPGHVAVAAKAEAAAEAAPEAAADEAVAAAVDAGIAQAGAGPFGFLVPVRRKGKVLVLDAGVLLERPLGMQHAPDAGAGQNQCDHRAEAELHPLRPVYRGAPNPARKPQGSRTITKENVDIEDCFGPLWLNP